ncbi:MAG: response regulator [Phormidesmis sp.]
MEILPNNRNSDINRPTEGSISKPENAFKTTADRTDKSNSLRILLAEDNFVNQRLALIQLEHLGYKADLVSNGEAVLKALETQAYDVILMDVHMPAMCGITATQKINQLYPAQQRPYIIALTAGATEDNVAECLAAGMQDYVQKPVNPAALEKALNCVKQRSNLVGTEDSSEDSSEDSLAGPLNQPGTWEKQTQSVPVVDEHVIDNIRKMAGPTAPALLKQLFNNYFELGSVMLENIYQAIESNHDVAIYKAAHRLRSSSATLGLAQLAQVCEHLEDQGRAGKRVTLETYKPALEAAYLAAKAACMHHM